MLFSIQHADVAFPQGQVSSSARVLLRALLVKDARLRLGSARGLHELAQHIYFELLDFSQLERRFIRPPFVPALHSSADTLLFDNAFTSQSVSLHVYKSTGRTTPRRRAEGRTHDDARVRPVSGHPEPWHAPRAEPAPTE